MSRVVAGVVMLLTCVTSCGGGQVTSSNAPKAAPAAAPVSLHARGDSSKPPRWYCDSDGSISIEPERTGLHPHCASLREFIAEVNVYSTWKLVYTGPDAADILQGSDIDPEDTSKVMDLLRECWAIQEDSRDTVRHEIYLRATAAFKPSSLSFVHLKVEDDRLSPRFDLPVKPGECRNFMQAGDVWVWCLNVPIAQGLTAFNARASWALELSNSLPPTECVSFLASGNDVDGLLNQLESMGLREIPEAHSDRHTVLTGEIKEGRSEPCAESERS